MKIPGPDDSTLLKALRNGDEKAIKTFYYQHYPPLRIFTEYIVGDKLEAEDIATDAFLKLFKAIKADQSFETAINLKSFLYVVAKRDCLTYLRTTKNHDRIEREILETLEKTEPGSDKQIIESEVLADIYKEVEKLPHREKEIFKLAYYEGLTNAEIAKKLNISPNTVKNTKASASEKLKIAMKNYPFLLFVLFGICAN